MAVSSWAGSGLERLEPEQKVRRKGAVGWGEQGVAEAGSVGEKHSHGGDAVGFLPPPCGLPHVSPSCMPQVGCT